MSPKGDKRDKGDSRDNKTWLAFKPDIQLFVMGSFAMFLLWNRWKNQSLVWTFYLIQVTQNDYDRNSYPRDISDALWLLVSSC